MHHRWPVTAVNSESFLGQRARFLNRCAVRLHYRPFERPCNRNCTGRMGQNLPSSEQELASAMSDSLRALLDSTPLGAGNAPYIESLYEQFLADPASVEPKWRDYFAGLAAKAGGASDVAHGPIRDALAKRAYSVAAAPAAAASSNFERCLRQTRRRLATGAGVFESRPPDREHRSAGLDAPAGARSARAVALRPERCRSGHRVPHRQPRRCDSEAR